MHLTVTGAATDLDGNSDHAFNTPVETPRVLEDPDGIASGNGDGITLLKVAFLSWHAALSRVLGKDSDATVATSSFALTSPGGSAVFFSGRDPHVLARLEATNSTLVANEHKSVVNTRVSAGSRVELATSIEPPSVTLNVHSD